MSFCGFLVNFAMSYILYIIRCNFKLNTNMNKLLLAVSLLCCPLGMVNAQVQININMNSNQPKKPVSPTLYGIFFEDINHAADGGLYAELIRNRSFEDNDSVAECWSPVSFGKSAVNTSLITKKLLNDKQGHALEMQVVASKNEKAGISNTGYWGINAVQGRTYHLTFWAKCKGRFKGNLTAMMTSEDNCTTYASVTFDKPLNAKWQKYTATLVSNSNDPKAAFVLLADAKGTIDVDMVSLFPPTFRNRENGCRPDLAQLLYNLHPKFMRFPGGCFVEGNINSDNAFHWQRTVGPIEQRPGHHNANWGYRTSDGMGFQEFLQLCEDINAKPLYVVNIGIWHGGFTPIDSLQPWIDECMQALEYANGDASTKYGKMRADNGHPAPYNIEYIEIGNENNQANPNSQSDHYYDRYMKFRETILAKYPNMHLIGNVAAWGTDTPKWGSGDPVEMVDEHYYRNPSWFAEQFHKYDFYNADSYKVYAGEYAVTSGFGKVGNLNAALGESIYMMGMENNSDVVVMSSYAPIFVNENDQTWKPDMIRFNSSQVVCTPSYYSQKMMSNNIGTSVLKVTQINPYKDMISKSKESPIYNIGVGSYKTQASYRQISIKCGDKTISKTTDDCASWDNYSGKWNSDNGVISQTSDNVECVNILKSSQLGEKYSYQLEARKNTGDEGFLIVFNQKDKDNYCWLNLGGWGNTQHGIEQTVDGGRSTLTTVNGKIETGRWYDIRIDVNGDSLKCYLDGTIIFNTVLKPCTFNGIFSNATYNENSGQMYVKIVNTQNTATTAQINLDNLTIKTAEVERLTSSQGKNENTMDMPTNVYPQTEQLSPNGNVVSVHIPAYSLNIVKIKK